MPQACLGTPQVAQSAVGCSPGGGWYGRGRDAEREIVTAFAVTLAVPTCAVATWTPAAATRGAAWQRTMGAYSDLPSMTVGLMSVNLATSARTSVIAGSASAAVMASDEANSK